MSAYPEVDFVANQTARDIARWLRKLARHPSPCDAMPASELMRYLALQILDGSWKNVACLDASWKNVTWIVEKRSCDESLPGWSPYA